MDPRRQPAKGTLLAASRFDQLRRTQSAPTALPMRTRRSTKVSGGETGYRATRRELDHNRRERTTRPLLSGTRPEMILASASLRRTQCPTVHDTDSRDPIVAGNSLIRIISLGDIVENIWFVRRRLQHGNMHRQEMKFPARIATGRCRRSVSPEFGSASMLRHRYCKNSLSKRLHR